MIDPSAAPPVLDDLGWSFDDGPLLDLPMDLPEETEELAIRPGVKIPGTDDDLEIKLEEAQLLALAKEIEEKVDTYDERNGERVRRWDEIEEHYDLVPPQGAAGEGADGESLVSELLMSQVDQAAARMESALAGQDPLAEVAPIRSRGPEMERWAADAEAAESLLNNYTVNECKFGHLRPILCHRAAKLGTAVVHALWQKRTHRVWWDNPTGMSDGEEQELGRVEYELVDNRTVVVWPPTAHDWQDAEILGHYSVYSKYAWKRKAKELGLDEETIARIEASGGADEREAAETELDAVFDPVKLYKLYCTMPLPGLGETRFTVWFHHDTCTIARLEHNPYPEQRMPYFPVRWKLTDRSCWGDGVGDEVLNNQAMASALDNLEIENIFAGAFYAHKVLAGSTADTALDRLRPGEKIPVDAMTDWETEKMGGEAPEIGASQERNWFRARNASGQSAVLSGQGDPVQKSGTGTGATRALIEQSGVKFNSVGNRVMMDLAALFEFTLELLVMYAPNGVLYAVASKEDAGVLEMLQYKPPKRRLRNALRVTVRAPSASTDRESRQMHYLAMFNFTVELLKVTEESHGPILMQENQATYMRWKRQWVALILELARRVIDYHDLPGLSQMVPEIPTPTPDEQIIQQQQMEIMQLQGELQNLTQQIQQHMAAMAAQGAGPPQPPMMPGPPPMMPSPMPMMGAA